MPILWVAAEDVTQIINSGEAQAIIHDLNIGAALSAAGWVISAGIAIWQQAGTPAIVTGIQFVWDTVTGGGNQPPI